jgi:hypothetical protein
MAVAVDPWHTRSRLRDSRVHLSRKACRDLKPGAAVVSREHRVSLRTAVSRRVAVDRRNTIASGGNGVGGGGRGIPMRPADHLKR